MMRTRAEATVEFRIEPPEANEVSDLSRESSRMLTDDFSEFTKLSTCTPTHRHMYAHV